MGSVPSIINVGNIAKQMYSKDSQLTVLSTLLFYKRVAEVPNSMLNIHGFRRYRSYIDENIIELITKEISGRRI